MKYLGSGYITDPPRVVERSIGKGDIALDLLCGLEHVTALLWALGSPVWSL